VTPFAVVHPLAAGLHLDAARAHVHEQEEEAVQQLHGEEVNARPALRRALQAPVAIEQQAAGLRGAEVKGDGARLLGAPTGQGDVGTRRIEADRVEGGHVLTAEGQVAVQVDFGVA
uniref:Uncharacterized protein n=1 Tax=Electrophorus electricus TaxID=8005 RepID=A0A4W4EZK7_ELEEL